MNTCAELNASFAVSVTVIVVFVAFVTLKTGGGIGLHAHLLHSWLCCQQNNLAGSPHSSPYSSCPFPQIEGLHAPLLQLFGQTMVVLIKLLLGPQVRTIEVLELRHLLL